MIDRPGSAPGEEAPDRVDGCDEALARLYDFLDGELPDASRDQVVDHLERCRCCWPHFNFERLFLDRLAAVGELPEPCPDLAEKIRGVLDAEGNGS